MPNSNMESVEEIHVTLQHELGEAWEKYDTAEYSEAQDFEKWGEEYEAAYAKAKAALTRREERIKVEAQIDLLKNLPDNTGTVDSDRGSAIPIEEIGYCIKELEKQLKTLDGQENTNGE